MKSFCLVLAVLGTAATAVLGEVTACPGPPKDLFGDLICANRFKREATYRPIDGVLARECSHPAKSFEAYSHLGGIHYSDCDWAMRKAVDGQELPTARTITNEIFRKFHREVSANFTAPNLLCTMMAQLYAHDLGGMSNTPNAGKILPECCLDSRLVENPHPYCAAIQLGPNDPDHGETLPNATCVFVPRAWIKEDTAKPTLTRNTVTAFLDVSFVYGSTAADLASIREYAGGRLKTDELNIMPLNAAGAYYIGDSRVMQTPQLAVQHSIWLREHNRLVGILAAMNAQWDDETLFQEARRIVIAEYQNLIWSQFLPSFFHPTIVAMMDLPDVTAVVGGSTYAEFGQAIFRSFHSLLPKMVTFVDAEGVETAWRFHDMLLNNQPILQSHYEDIVRGLQRQTANVAGYEKALFSKLFTNDPKMPGFDLPSVDIIRGRDHGLPPYANIFQFVKGGPVNSFDDLESHMSMENIVLLKNVYASVHDIDLYVGALLERPMEGTLWGPTIQLVVLKQFALAKTSDPYFYTHVLGNPKRFTSGQLDELKKFNSNYLYCLNTNITRVPVKPSYPAKTDADYIDCHDLVPISYEQWRE